MSSYLQTWTVNYLEYGASVNKKTKTKIIFPGLCAPVFKVNYVVWWIL